MQRYFVEPSQMDDNQVRIVGDDVKHIQKVLRMSVGDKIVCCDNESRTALCEITELESEFVQTKVMKWIQEEKELPIYVTIGQGLPKSDKLDMIVQKGTELGAFQFIPFSADRSVVKWNGKKVEKKIERLQKIAKEAAEQSHRSKIPKCHTVMSFKELLHASQKYQHIIVAYEEVVKGDSESKSSLKSILNKISPGDSVLFLVGPEGGLSEREVEQLKEEGFHICGLGPRILRTETAGLYFLSVASYNFEH